MASRLIADYALLSDCHSAALVSNDGSIDWLYAPAFDSPSVFGRLLDERAGHWSMGVRDANKVARHYIDGTLALQSTFETDSGSVELLDMLALREHERGHDIGRGSPHCLLRSALWVADCPEEAQKLLAFLAQAGLTQLRQGTELQILYGLRGEHDLSERTLPHLAGWRDSSPVRIGNGAWNQRQLDVYGKLPGAVYVLREHLTRLPEATREFIVAAVDVAASRWEEKDQGIWGIRGEPRDFLYSKLMCWVALDRGIRLAELLNAQCKVEAWRAVCERIRGRILREGWSEKTGAYPRTFGSDDLDASSLMLPIVGFLPATDPRMLSTIDAIVSGLTDELGLVDRYRAMDGLSGEEGSFLFCTFWLAQALALAGQLDRAKATFETALSFANDGGLLSKEVLPETREPIGNFPQAFSHIRFVNAAWAIANLEQSLRSQDQDLA